MATTREDGWELGRLKWVTDRVVRDAIALVCSGIRISLGVEWDNQHTPPLWPGRRPPQLQPIKNVETYRNKPSDTANGARFMSEHLDMDIHSGTHLDTIGHVWYDDAFYGGISVDKVKNGSHPLGVHTIARHGIIVPAILVDLPRYLHCSTLPDDYHISTDIIDEYLAYHEIPFSGVHALILRTGRRPPHSSSYMEREPGLVGDDKTLEWLAHRPVVLYGTDTVGNERTVDRSDPLFQNLHRRALRDLGLAFLETLRLEELAQHCAQVGHWVFCLIASPLNLRGASGSPINPLAIF